MTRARRRHCVYNITHITIQQENTPERMKQYILYSGGDTVFTTYIHSFIQLSIPLTIISIGFEFEFRRSIVSIWECDLGVDDLGTTAEYHYTFLNM